VDVVVPFRGSDRQLSDLSERLLCLQTGPQDSVTVVDNGPGALTARRASAGIAVVAAAERPGSYRARNRGAHAGRAPWLLFLDADVDWPSDLIAHYFEPAPRAGTAVLAGGVLDEVPGAGPSLSVRYAWLKGSMGHGSTLGHGRWAFAQTANCVVRRAAFEAVGGFVDDVRSGGDADLCFRLAEAGWGLEARLQAAVVHRNRATLGQLARQLARHGSGAAWLTRRHPGCLPRRHWPGLAWWSLRRAAAGVGAAVGGRGDEALVGLLDGPAVWAFELGRLAPNRIATARGWGREDDQAR